jgi:hypothetical protein
MNKKRTLIFLSAFLSILTLGYLFIKPAFKYLNGYLAKSEQVKANILIVEGWLSLDMLEMAYEEFRKNGYEYVITTGLKSNTDYYELSSKGHLIFDTRKKFAQTGGYGAHSIEIDAYTKPGLDDDAHLRVYFNDYLAADIYPDISKKKYKINWNGSLNKIDSIILHFKNDKMGKSGNQYLYFKEIKIDNKITLPYFNNSEFDIINPGGRLKIINNFSSNAELSRNLLIAMGIDSAHIIATPGKQVVINRTLTSALAFRDWVKKADIKVKGINIFSMGVHARRTWMIYNRVLNEKYDIGIISIPDSKGESPQDNKLLKTVREALGIIYYWFILIPY